MNESYIKHHNDQELHDFVVEGSGEFPFDMLRHSEAWPADTLSAGSMAGDVCAPRRRVMLRARDARYVKPERWASFDWKVVAGFDNGYAIEIVDYFAAMGRRGA